MLACGRCSRGVDRVAWWAKTAIGAGVVVLVLHIGISALVFWHLLKPLLP